MRETFPVACQHDNNETRRLPALKCGARRATADFCPKIDRASSMADEIDGGARHAGVFTGCCGTGRPTDLGIAASSWTRLNVDSTIDTGIGCRDSMPGTGNRCRPGRSILRPRPKQWDNGGLPPATNDPRAHEFSHRPAATSRGRRSGITRCSHRRDQRCVGCRVRCCVGRWVVQRVV